MTWWESGVILTSVLPLIALLAAFLILMSGWILRDSWGRATVFLCWVLSGCCVAGGMTWAHSEHSNLDIPQITTLVKQFLGNTSDALNLMWTVCSTLLLVVLTWGPQSEGTRGAVFRRQASAGAALLGASQLLSQATHAWLQWSCLVWCGWLLSTLLMRDEQDRRRGQAASTCLVWFTIADLMWLTGLISISLVMPGGDLAYAGELSVLQQLSAGELAIGVLGGTFLVGALVLRSSLYPLMSWSAPATVSYRDAAWIIGFGLGPAVLLVYRWQTLLTEFADTRLMIAGAGLLSALLLGLMAWGATGLHRPARMVHAAASQVGLIWLGIGANHPGASDFQVWTISLLWLLPMICLGIEQLRQNPAGRTAGVFTLLLLAAVLCSGVLGQERLFEVTRRTDLPGAVNPWVLFAGALLTQGLFSLNLFREIRIVPAQVAENPESHVLAVHTADRGNARWAFVAVFAWGGLAALLVTGAQVGRINLSVIPIPLLSGLVMGIGLIAALTWPISGGRNPAGTGGRFDSLRELANSEFYAPLAINFLLILPIRAASQISRFLEWIVIGNLTQKIPAGLLKWVAVNAALQDEESSDQSRMWQLASTTAVMLAGVALGAAMTLRQWW